MYNVFFISFKETNCEDNWRRVKTLHPDAIRLHGILGIDRAHLLCDELSTSNHFWTVDGDNFLTRPLEYTDTIETDLLMFKAIDPIHKNLTLLGGVKLWKKGSIINRNMSKGDFSLNATKNKKVIEDCFSETLYNVSKFDTWKTSFRHCVKLLSVIFRNRPNAANIDIYLNQWKTSIHSDSNFSEWAYQGYVDAENYVKIYDTDLNQLYKINDYVWLEEYFGKLHESS
jgi:hypothetical protein